MKTKQKNDNQKTSQTLGKTLGYCLSKAAMRSKAMFDEALKPYNLLTYQYAVLRILTCMGPTSQILLGNELGIDKASMVRFLDGLEKEGYIQRTSDSVDRRVKKIELTAKGKKMFSIAEKIRVQVQEEFLSPLSKSERAAYAKIIPKLVK